MMNSMMSLKDKILEEILEDLDDQEGMKLKPKSAVSITAVKPGEEDEAMPHPDELAGISGKGDDEENDDDLKALLQQYLSEK